MRKDAPGKKWSRPEHSFLFPGCSDLLLSTVDVVDVSAYTRVVIKNGIDLEEEKHCSISWSL